MRKRFVFSLFLLSFLANSQTFNQEYANVSNLVSQSNINSYLEEFEALGVKTTGSTANNNAYTWLKNKYLSFGYTENDISKDNFTYNGQSTSNIIVTKQGTKYPNIYIIVCGHYDTIVGTEPMIMAAVYPSFWKQQGFLKIYPQNILSNLSIFPVKNKGFWAPLTM